MSISHEDKVAGKSVPEVILMLDMSGLSYEVATVLMNVSECMITDARNSEEVFKKQRDEKKEERKDIVALRDSLPVGDVRDVVIKRVRSLLSETNALEDAADDADHEAKLFTAIRFVLDTIPR